MNGVEEETRLVIDACQGSLAAFEALVKQYEPRIRRMIYGLTQDPQLTQDLCQETLLAVYRALPRMEGQSLHFASWLYRIALNQVRYEWRRRKGVSVLPFSSFLDEDQSSNEFERTYQGHEDQFEERVVQQDLVQHVLARLPQASVACLLLDAEGFSNAEIAEILQDSLSAVRSRLSRARQAFQRVYQGLTQERKE